MNFPSLLVSSSQSATGGASSSSNPSNPNPNDQLDCIWDPESRKCFLAREQFTASRGLMLGFTSFCATLSFILIFIVYKVRRDRTVASSRWIMIEMILIGSVLLYLTVVIRYFEPDPITCVADPWFRELGFGLFHGSIVIKLYRIWTEFQTRKAHRICVRDQDLLKYLAIILVVIIGYLSAWTALITEMSHQPMGQHGAKSSSPNLASSNINEESWRPSGAIRGGSGNSRSRRGTKEFNLSARNLTSSGRFLFPRLNHDQLMMMFGANPTSSFEDQDMMNDVMASSDTSSSVSLEDEEEDILGANTNNDDVMQQLILMAALAPKSSPQTSINHHERQSQAGLLSSSNNFMKSKQKRGAKSTTKTNSDQSSSSSSSSFALLLSNLTSHVMMGLNESSSSSLLLLHPNFSNLLVSVRLPDGRYYRSCRHLSWDYVTQAGELTFLMTGMYVTYCIRNARTEIYREKRVLCTLIFLEFIVSAATYILRHVLYSRGAHPDLMYYLYFARTQLTVTVSLVALLGPKLWNHHVAARAATGAKSRAKFGASSSGANAQATSLTEGPPNPNDQGDGGAKSDPSGAEKDKAREVNKREAQKRLHAAIMSSSADHAHEDLMTLDISDVVNLREMEPDEIRAELRRVYTQLQVLKNKNMRRDNPHISKRKGGRKMERASHRRFSLQPFSGGPAERGGSRHGAHGASRAASKIDRGQDKDRGDVNDSPRGGSKGGEGEGKGGQEGEATTRMIPNVKIEGDPISRSPEESVIMF